MSLELFNRKTEVKYLNKHTYIYTKLSNIAKINNIKRPIRIILDYLDHTTEIKYPIASCVETRNVEDTLFTTCWITIPYTILKQVKYKHRQILFGDLASDLIKLLAAARIIFEIEQEIGMDIIKSWVNIYQWIIETLERQQRLQEEINEIKAKDPMFTRI